MLARVAAHGEHIVLPGREHAFLERAPLEWLPIDGRSRGELAALGVKRIAGLADLPRGTLFHHLKLDAARRILAMLQGRDASQVEPLYPSPHLEERLGSLESLDEAGVLAALSGACVRLFTRLQRRRRWPRALALVVEPFFGSPVRAEGELVRPPARVDDLARRFTVLLRDLWRGDELSALSLFADDLQSFSPGQYGLGFSSDPAGLTILEQVMDALRERYGDRALLRATHLPDHRRWAGQLWLLLIRTRKRVAYQERSLAFALYLGASLACAGVSARRVALRTRVEAAASVAGVGSGARGPCGVRDRAPRCCL